MSNETTTAILDYAEMHHDFSIEDLFAYLHERTGINRSSLSWYLFKLVDDNALVRTRHVWQSGEAILFSETDR